NWITIYKRVAGRGKSGWGEQARDSLAREFEDRRQYVKAAAAWRTAIEEYGKGHNEHRQKRLDQIIGNWGQFEGQATQPAGSKASVDFRFRIGKKVRFQAQAVKVDKLLADVQDYLKKLGNKPGVWQQINISDIGYRLVWENQTQYLG